MSAQAKVAALARRPGPLAGVLLLELCGDEPAGTFGTQILADLGATVVKVERLPAGEKEATSPKVPVPEGLAYFWGMNRNKLSLASSGRPIAAQNGIQKLVEGASESHRPSAQRNGP